MKRRYDLIPNLMETVKGYAAHEKGVFEKLPKQEQEQWARKLWGDHAAAENMLTGALKSLFAVSENYPDLKANQNFLELQRELTDAEDKIQAARRFYNGNVRDMNTIESSRQILSPGLSASSNRNSLNSKKANQRRNNPLKSAFSL